jgi:hypothetical protein
MRVASLILLILLPIMVLSCNEAKDIFYNNIYEAKHDGAIERGWIPPILPDSSVEIWERHLIDSNRVWIKFRFDKADIRSMIDGLELVNQAEIATLEFPNPGVNWWPKEINKETFMTGRQLPLVVYKYRRVITYSENRQKIIPAFFVIDWESNIAYYWQVAN